MGRGWPEGGGLLRLQAAPLPLCQPYRPQLFESTRSHPRTPSLYRSMAGVNSKNVDYLAEAMHKVTTA